MMTCCESFLLVLLWLESYIEIGCLNVIFLVILLNALTEK